MTEIGGLLLSFLHERLQSEKVVWKVFVPPTIVLFERNRPLFRRSLIDRQNDRQHLPGVTPTDWRRFAALDGMRERFDRPGVERRG